MHLIDCRHAWGLNLSVCMLNGVQRLPWRHNALDSPAIYILRMARVLLTRVLSECKTAACGRQAQRDPCQSIADSAMSLRAAS